MSVEAISFWRIVAKMRLVKRSCHAIKAPSEAAAVQLGYLGWLFTGKLIASSLIAERRESQSFLQQVAQAAKTLPTGFK